MRFVLIFAAGLLFSVTVFAQHQELIIKEDIEVYKNRDLKSGVLTRLERGQRVPLSTRDYGAWAKIKVDVGGKTYYGWLPKKDIRGFRIRKVDREAITGKSLPYYRKRGFGLHTNMSYASLGEEEMESSDNKKITVDGADGSSVFFGFFYDYPFSDNQQLHLFLSLRKHDVEGKAILDGNPNKIDLDMTQNFLAFGATLKNYSSKRAAGWWAYGLEIAKTTAIDLKLSGIDTDIPDEELAFFVFPHLATGYDYRLSSNLYLIPEAKLNLAINTGALTYALDLKMALSYTF